jgi:hypothetical protein
MRPETRNHWREPGYWRWWFRTRIPTETKVVLGLLVAIVVLASGFLSAGKLDGREVSSQVVTVVRTTRVAGKPPRVVTEVRTISEPAETTVVTRQRGARKVVVLAPGETVIQSRTVRGPGRVVTQELTNTVTRTRDRVRTVVGPGSTVQGPERVVTTPGTTVTAPGRTETQTISREVTLPAKTITETAPAKTVTTEVTQPPETVTETTEVTITEEVTVTETVKK